MNFNGVTWAERKVGEGDKTDDDDDDDDDDDSDESDDNEDESFGVDSERDMLIWLIVHWNSSYNIYTYI
jgi:hypothetical protein